MQLTEEQERWQKEALSRGMEIVENFHPSQKRQQIATGYFAASDASQMQHLPLYLLGKLLLELDVVRGQHPE